MRKLFLLSEENSQILLSYLNNPASSLIKDEIQSTLHKLYQKDITTFESW